MPSFNPFGDNPFLERKDVAQAFEDLFEPLAPLFSPGGARLRIEETGAFCELISADLEGFSRPLWGLVPFVAGGGDFKHWKIYNQGLANGCNPDHPEYWGETEDLEQRLVEFAAIGFALAYIPEKFFDPLPEADKKNVLEYLVRASTRRYPTTNWKWFHVLLTIGLKRVNAAYDHSITENNLEDMEEYYLKDGWYGDGPDKNAIDYYNPFAFHFYKLMYLKLCPDDKVRGEIYLNRVKEFVGQFIHWMGDDGAALPFGRSLVYKFACGSFWGALAFSEQEIIPWGIVKGLYLRHLRWWGKQPFARGNSGIMSMGYCYPNAVMCERYNSPQSAYWGTKIFFPLLLPESHPFWQAEELPLSALGRPNLKALPVPGMVFTHNPGNTVALVSGPYQNGSYVRWVGEKYSKFAYSTRYGFSVETNGRNFSDATLDNMIGFAEDDEFFRFRLKCKAKIHGDILYSVWYPWANVKVETWLIPKGAWHVRVHRIYSERQLTTVEGGFSISAMETEEKQKRVVSGSGSYVSNSTDFSGIVNLTGKRDALTNKPEPSSSLYWSKTLVPQLRGTIPANKEVILSCAVIAQPDLALCARDWKNPPTAPSLDILEQAKENGIPVLAEK